MFSNPSDLSVLTPGHFLIGDSLTSLPEPEITEERRPKWKSATTLNPPQVGSIVLIKDDRLPPLKWSPSRILELFYGEDDVARVASVQTMKGVIKRPIRKLCPLPIDS
ncbi:hypothetical protein Trydic_g18307 [Trypoxylus dichotomus]